MTPKELEDMTALIEKLQAEQALLHKRITTLEQATPHPIILGTPQTPKICPNCGKRGAHVCK